MSTLVVSYTKTWLPNIPDWSKNIPKHQNTSKALRPVASSVSLQSAAAKAAALPEARRRRPEQQEGSGSHPAEADRRGSSGADGPTIITDFVDRRGGSSRQTGFTGHTTHEDACDRRPQEDRCPSHKQIFSTNPPRALGAGRGGGQYPPCPSLISEQNQKKTH